MPTIVIRIDPTRLENPDLDLRYQIPLRLEAASNGLLQDQGYDYEFEGDITGDEAIQIVLGTSDLQAALPFVTRLLVNERLLDNDLMAASTVGVTDEAPHEFTEARIVFPEGASGTIRMRKLPLQ